MVNRIHSYPLTTGIVALVWTLCLMPGQDIPKVGFVGIDKLVHLAMYWLCCTAYYVEALQLKPSPKWRTLALVGVVAPIIMGALIEVAQDTVAIGRGADVADFVADLLGVLLAVPTTLAGRYLTRWCE